MIEILKRHQQKIALGLGFAAVAAIGFWGGLNMRSQDFDAKSVNESSVSSNYSETVSNAQTTGQNLPSAPAGDLNCEGKIKGSSSHIYHVPGGAFYTKTSHPIACFDSESQAQAAGFRKSSR